MIINFLIIIQGRDMKRYLLKKLARAAEYTAERGQGWPTYWGFHELVTDTNVKEMIKNFRNYYQ